MSTSTLNVSLFWTKVERTAGCWLWKGPLIRGGYGQSRPPDGMRKRVAHRVAYELLVGPIPAGMTLDHLCRNPRCVKPAHLEPVSMRENILRGTGLAAQNARKTECKHGHPFDSRNTTMGISRGRPRRRCRMCEQLRRRRAS